MDDTPLLKLRMQLKVTPLTSVLISAVTLLGLVYGVASHWSLLPCRRADAYVQIAEPEAWTDEPAVGEVCQRWQADWPPIKPVADLQEMSGIVSSRIYKNILYH